MAIGRYDGYSIYREEPIRLPEKSPEDEFLSEKEALSKFEKACEGCTSDEGCCAIIGLKKAGWDVSKNPTITYGGREGFVLTCLKPMTKQLTA